MRASAGAAGRIAAAGHHFLRYVHAGAALPKFAAHCRRQERANLPTTAARADAADATVAALVSKRRGGVQHPQRGRVVAGLHRHADAFLRDRRCRPLDGEGRNRLGAQRTASAGAADEMHLRRGGICTSTKS
jgi:hypothetical protein